MERISEPALSSRMSHKKRLSGKKVKDTGRIKRPASVFLSDFIGLLPAGYLR